MRGAQGRITKVQTKRVFEIPFNSIGLFTEFTVRKPDRRQSDRCGDKYNINQSGRMRCREFVLQKPTPQAGFSASRGEPRSIRNRLPREQQSRVAYIN